VVVGLGGFTKEILVNEMACSKIFTTGYFIRYMGKTLIGYIK
jgi:hypothetical protein|tara:strand:- start:2294 stop:2419 length:126 start_codon:yes stop_codon:yes gene_type:complete